MLFEQYIETLDPVLMHAGEMRRTPILFLLTRIRMRAARGKAAAVLRC